MTKQRKYVITLIAFAACTFIAFQLLLRSLSTAEQGLVGSWRWRGSNTGRDDTVTDLSFRPDRTCTSRSRALSGSREVITAEWNWQVIDGDLVVNQRSWWEAIVPDQIPLGWIGLRKQPV